MKIRISSSFLFILISSFFLILTSYLLTTKTSLKPHAFISICGKILKNASKHLYFNPSNIFSNIILFTTSIGIILALWQLIKFLIAYEKLLITKTFIPKHNKLQWIIDKYNLEKNILVVKKSPLTAYTIGLFSPKIIISQSIIKNLTKKQLEAVILHEIYHLKNKHVLWLLITKLISSLFFFVPILKSLTKELQTEFELNADAFVIKQQNTKNYLRESLALNLQYINNGMPHFATSPIEKRVEILTNNKLLLEKINIKSLTMSFLSLLIMLSIAFIKPNDVVANATLKSQNSCNEKKKCQTIDCITHRDIELHNFNSSISASFPFLSSY